MKYLIFAIFSTDKESIHLQSSSSSKIAKYLLVTIFIIEFFFYEFIYYAFRYHKNRYNSDSMPTFLMCTEQIFVLWQIHLTIWYFDSRITSLTNAQFIIQMNVCYSPTSATNIMT